MQGGEENAGEISPVVDVEFAEDNVEPNKDRGAGNEDAHEDDGSHENIVATEQGENASTSISDTKFNDACHSHVLETLSVKGKKVY